MNKNKIICQTVLAALQTLTGATLIAFGLFHLFGNSMINFGQDWFNFYTSHLNHTALFVRIFIWLVSVGLLLHGSNGLRIVWRYFKKAPAVYSYLIDTKYRDSSFWYVHFSTGILIGIAVVYHLAIACWGATEAVTTAEMIKAQLQNNYYFAFMNVLLVAGIFHACYGLKTIFVKYGFLTEHLRKIKIAFLIIGIAFMVIGINNLFIFRGLP